MSILKKDYMFGKDNLFVGQDSSAVINQGEPPDTEEKQRETRHEVETNLYKALRDLEPQLLRMGIVEVGARASGTAKEISESLQINIKGAINDLNGIIIDFWYSNGDMRTISTVAWQDESNHLSGAASAETFKERIKKKLGIVGGVSEFEPELAVEEEPLDWSDFGEIRLHTLFSKDFLLGGERFSNLDIRRGAQALSGGSYEIFIKSFPTQVVVEVEYNVLELVDPVSRGVASALKKQVIHAIEKAHLLKIKQVIVFSPSIQAVNGEFVTD